MASIKQFEDILAWQQARVLCQKVGALVDAERFGKNFRLIGQIEGSTGSIMDNIAEGFERGGNREFIQYLSIAKASCAETRSQLYRSLDRNYINPTEFKELTDQLIYIGNLIQKLIQYLSASDMKGSKYKLRETSKTNNQQSSIEQPNTEQSSIEQLNNQTLNKTALNKTTLNNRTTKH